MLPEQAISFADMRLLTDPLVRSELESAAGIRNEGPIWCGVVQGASASVTCADRSYIRTTESETSALPRVKREAHDRHVFACRWIFRRTAYFALPLKRT